jgi:hypothetical protein
MTDTDVAKICSFQSPKFSDPGRNAVLYNLDWLIDRPYLNHGDSVLAMLRTLAKITPLKERDNLQEPRRFLGSNRFMGLAPADAKLGDRIVRFWGCDVAAVLRNGPGEGLYIVGRADVSTPWEEAEQQPMYVEPSHTFSSGGVTEITLDIYALQKLTA